MKNGRLFFIYKDNRAMNMQHLKVIFKESILINTGSHLLIDDEKYHKKEINLSDFNTGQFLITCSRNEILMRQCLRYGLTIEHISFWEEIENENKEYIYELLRELKRTDISLNLKNLLFHELVGVIRDIEYISFEDNYISSIELKTPKGNNLIFSKNNLISFEEDDTSLVKDIISIFIE